MRFMLAALSAAGDFDASVTARYPDRITNAKAGRQAGINSAAVVFGPPGQDAVRNPL